MIEEKQHKRAGKSHSCADALKQQMLCPGTNVFPSHATVNAALGVGWGAEAGGWIGRSTSGGRACQHIVIGSPGRC